jgi:ParB family chromosome partitioning protein
LEALLGSIGEPVPGGHAIAGAGTAGGTTHTSGSTAIDGMIRIAVTDVEPNPFQPRREFDPVEIESLAASLQSHGLIQPIAVRAVGGGRYQLIAGERRLRAAMHVGWTEVPAKVLEADDRLAAELAIVENLQRKDLNPLEKALSFRQYIERYGCTQEELAARLQINRSTVANFIRLLELPDEIQRAVCNEKITYGHARALLPLGDEREQLEMCREIQAQGLSVRAVEDLVQDRVAAADGRSDDDDGARPAKPKPTRSKHTATLEQQLRLALGTKVDIRQSARGRGKITVHFANPEEFDRLFRHLQGPQYQSATG